MKEVSLILVHVATLLIQLIKPNGYRSVIAENLALKQQLTVLARGKSRSPNLKPSDRFLFGLLAYFCKARRLRKISVILKPESILRFHKALVDKKYNRIFGVKPKGKPGRKGPSKEMIRVVVEIKKKNPRFGYLRIAMQIFHGFGIRINPESVGRILKKHMSDFPDARGPSWLTFLEDTKDSLWSVDLFRCESISLQSHWVMIVMDQFTRRIVGFAVCNGPPEGVGVCRMLNQILSSLILPKYLSSDNDPLFQINRWKANLRVLDIEEIKSVPYTPVSHPFVERAIGITRQEYLDHTLFFNTRDLQRKLDKFKNYYNEHRAHSSINWKSPNTRSDNGHSARIKSTINKIRLQSHCNGLAQLPA